eukprot:3600287-Rhodomonas_salina.1
MMMIDMKIDMTIHSRPDAVRRGKGDLGRVPQQLHQLRLNLNPSFRARPRAAASASANGGPQRIRGPRWPRDPSTPRVRTQSNGGRSTFWYCL